MQWMLHLHLIYQYEARHTIRVSYVVTETKYNKSNNYFDSYSCYNDIIITTNMFHILHGLYTTEMYLPSYVV